MKLAVTPDRAAVGALLIVLGGAALVEARRLHALRETMVAGAVVGDDTFPMILGGAMLLLGVLCLVVPISSAHVTMPTAAIRAQMLWGMALVVAYWAMLPTVGYTASTAIVSTGLFRAMGRYRWPIALLAGALTTGVLHLLFRVWLRQPLPSGWLGI